jgi:hypothetical protein
MSQSTVATPAPSTTNGTPAPAPAPAASGTLSREGFRTHAKPVPLTINGQPLTADPKEFSTGSLGWYCNGKLTVVVNGVLCKVQIGLNLTVVGSKELPR